MSMRRDWDDEAEHWIAWTRTGLDDSFFRFHGAHFFELVPPPGRLTLDLGAGEGRVARALRARGHTVIEVDGSPRLAAASVELGGRSMIADAARLPLRPAIADCAIAFMSFQDVDDYEAAIREAARVLEPGGRLVLAIVHPINSAGEFLPAGPGEHELDRAFMMYRSSYFEHRHYDDDVARDGLPMRFSSEHRPIESYSRALEAAGFVIEAIREVGDAEGKWTRMPLFLDVRAARRESR